MLNSRTVLPTALAGALLLAACGSPTDPSGDSDGSSVTSTAYMGSVQLPGGVTGLLMARVGASSASLERPSSWFARWFELIEPALIAQGAATGEMTLSDLNAVVLSGTYSAGTFQLTGSGYSVTASGSGGSLSGTVTGPQGTGTLAPMPSGAPPGPLPANPDGYYFGDYSVAANGYTENTLSSGVLEMACVVHVVFSGRLKVRVQDGGVRAEMRDAWQEVMRLIPPCYPQWDYSEQTLKPDGEIGGTFALDGGRVQFGWVDGQFNGKIDPNNVRTTAFSGGFTSSTTIQGVLRKSRSGIVMLANGVHREGYPVTEVTVTLNKQ